MTGSPAPREHAATTAAAEAACDARDRLTEARGYRLGRRTPPDPPEQLAAAEQAYEEAHRAYLEALARETAAVERARTIQAGLSISRARPPTETCERPILVEPRGVRDSHLQDCGECSTCVRRARRRA